jgi:hypothetical protein
VTSSADPGTGVSRDPGSPDTAIIPVTGDCITWEGPAQAWRDWFEDCHSRAHRNGRDGLPALCTATIERA